MPVRIVVLAIIGCLLATAASASASDQRLAIKFYCLDIGKSEMAALKRDSRTGQLPEQLSMASAMTLLDQDHVKVVAFSRLDSVIGKEAAANSTHKASYLELAPTGAWMQKLSDWDEGVSARVTASIDGEGRIHVDGIYSLKAINSRAPLVGIEKWDLGRPLTHSTVTINPAVVLRAGEARLIEAFGNGAPDSDRVLVVVVQKLAED
ncbi:MAG: hypothetical protein H0W83_00525 [Planctomycetes bacterium]|nr:hypothetical protein [Planctomycetota bacterium]